jgi:RNA polymerase primary sigma factor
MQKINPFKGFPIRAEGRNISRAELRVFRPAVRPDSVFPSWPRGSGAAAPDEMGQGVLENEAATAVPARNENASAIDHSDDRSVLQLYLNEIRQTPLLSAEEERKLALRIMRGDEAAREHMIRANLRLVVKIAYDYSHLGLPILDLISEGNLGLIRAVERFDPSKGGKLSTYASWWIKQSMKRAVANQSKTIRLPMHLIDRIARMRNVINQYMEKLGREPDNDEIAFELGIPARKVALLKTVSVRPASLDAPLSEGADGAVLGDVVSDESARSPEEHLAKKTLFDDLRASVNALGPREAEILNLRFGLNGEEEMSLEEVGRRFNITRERIRQLQDLALRAVRLRLENQNRQRSLDEVKEERRAQKRSEIFREFVTQQSVRRAGV